MCVTTLAQSMLIVFGRQPQHGDPPAVGHVVDHRPAAPRRGRTSPGRCRSLRQTQLPLRLRHAGLADVDAPCPRPSALPAPAVAADTSVTTILRAPAWRATAIAISPIGPAPVIRTSSPTSGKLRAVCTALPNGSKMAPSSGVDVGVGCTQTLASGITTYSAKAPSRCTPDADRADAHLAPAGPAVAAGAADDVSLAGHPVPDRTSRTPVPVATTSP